MIVQCPYCGKSITVNGLGRKRLNIPLKNVCETLQSHRSVDAAAQKLNCSQGYIFQELKKIGKTPKEVISEKGNVNSLNL